MDVTHEWQGYQIQLGERGMWWVLRDGTNPMPGACCFETPEKAKKGIAALVVATAATAAQVKGAPSRGDVFWSLMELYR